MTRTVLAAALCASTILTALLPALQSQAASLVDRQTASTTGQPSQDLPPDPGTATATAEPDTVDLAALYYYARNGEIERVEAETRRLELKFSGFMIPADLYAPERGDRVDETSLWQLYERDDYTGIDQEISRLAAAHPGWEPSADFRTKLARRKMRVALTAAHAAKDYAAVIREGAGLDATQETEIDLLWMLIDAYRANSMQEPLTSLYRGILFRPSDSALADDVILTTLRKAMEDIPAAQLREAFQILSANPDLALGMTTLRLDLMRREIGDYVAGATTATVPSSETVSAIRQVAEIERNPKDLALMGWYALKSDDADAAVVWFQQMIAQHPSAEAVRGLVVSLVHLGKDEEAFTFVTSHLEILSEDDAFLVDQLSYPFRGERRIDLEDRIVSRYSEAIQKTESADHARLLGWYAYNSRQFEPAKAWFARAFQWKSEADSLKGLVLSATRLGQKAEVRDLRTRYAESYAEVFDEVRSALEPRGKTGKPVGAPTGVQARYFSSLQKKDYGTCISELRALEAKAGLRPDVLVIKGWCLLGLNHLAEAREAFTQGLAGGGGKADDAAYGLGLTLLRSNLTDDAEALLMRQNLTPLRERELRAEMLWQKARAAFDRKQYRQTLDALNLRLQIMPEPVGISQMRAWSHYHLGNLAQSRAIFAQLNQVVADPANSRGIAAINERMGITR